MLKAKFRFRKENQVPSALFTAPWQMQCMCLLVRQLYAYKQVYLMGKHDFPSH